MEDFLYKFSARNDGIFEDSGRRPQFFIRTYGCQMNDRDSEMLSGMLLQMGYEKAGVEDEAELILYNTCCVRERAENKIFGHLSRLKSRKAQEKGLLIVVCGCMTQQEGVAQTIATTHKYVDVVLGTGNRHRLPEFLWRRIETGKTVIDINEGDGEVFEDTPVTVRDYSHKAGVNIMTGCDNFCSFCIVPYVRGREKSRDGSDILREIQALGDDGVKEIMLLGQNVNSYGGGEFHNLLRQVNDVPGLMRIRFMTSHPRDFSDEIIGAVRDLDKVCKSVHLPLQSGSSRILTDMNRGYSKEQYLGLIERLRAEVPGVAVTTDIIVGYPGETEEDFLETLDVVRQARFDGAFMFIYSKRSGTPAAERTDLVPRTVSAERFERLTQTVYPILLERNEALVGRVVDVMVEENEAGKDGLFKGRADDGTLVHFACSRAVSAGKILGVRIESAKTFYVVGEGI